MDKSKQVAEIKRLCKNECANYCDGLCLPRDIGCTQYWNPTIVCKYFLNAVLPLNPELEEILVTDLFRRKREGDLRNGKITEEEAAAQEKAEAEKKSKAKEPVYKKCPICGKTFQANSNRQKYCTGCQKTGKEKQHAAYMRSKAQSQKSS